MLGDFTQHDFDVNKLDNRSIRSGILNPRSSRLDRKKVILGKVDLKYQK